MALVSSPWEGYYREFEMQAAYIVLAAESLHTLATHYDDVSATAARIRSIEEKGDALTAALLTRMERSPLAHPRDELRGIVTSLDDVLDALEAAADSFDLYDIAQPSAPATELIALATQCAQCVARAVNLLRAQGWHRRARLTALRPVLEEINRIENLSDQVYRGAMAALFRQQDVALMIKWKQVYDNLEAITDRCEDVGDALQTAVLRHA